MPDKKTKNPFGPFFDVFQDVLSRTPHPWGEEMAEPFESWRDQSEQMFKKWSDICNTNAESPDSEGEKRIDYYQLLNQISRQYLTFFNEMVGKYLNIPPMGLGGDAFQQMGATVHAHHKMMVALNEFLQAFSLPFAASMETFRHRFEEKKEGIESPKEVYDLLLEIVDKEYKTYLNSPEGVRCVTALVDRYLECKKNLDDAVSPLLAFHNIPTKSEMNEVYRRLHLLKKQNRHLESVARNQEGMIEALRRDLRALKRSTSAQKPKSAPSGRKSTRKKKPLPENPLDRTLDPPDEP